MYSWATNKKHKHCRGFLLGCYFSPPIKKGQRNEDKSENEEHWHQWSDRLVNYPLVFIRVLRRFPDVTGRWNLLFAFRWRLLIFVCSVDPIDSLVVFDFGVWKKIASLRS